ncbi:diacylglycerol/lipid kinase family protein [Amycolatopsis panacis]|uniref:Diacylglycerol kinase n=1 Tax=Amycolatopsis panacis TaxID=2340917 RepID=A0A419IBC9_9PSEU|nr:diacylglycerol kinase family protein [Amycolatopsis panacis]RJQ92292.1 diacylglycerol kinase [Amycolatopsis panacis]
MDEQAIRPSLARRSCALLALAAAAAALVVVIALLIRHPVELLITLVLVAIALAAAWAALVHRGVRRVIAVMVAVVAIGAPSALPDVRVYLVMLLYLCLAALSAALAKVAIGHRVAPGAGPAEVGPARHGVLLMNAKSGGGKVEKFGLEAEARKRGVRTVLLRQGDDLSELAERAVTNGADVLGMAGGDGSQALVADVARRHGIPFVCVPAGTRNHLALDLGLDRDNVVGALDAYGHAYERTIDLAMLGDRVFVNNASLGVYATVVQSAGYRDAKVSNIAASLPDLLGPNGNRPDLRFTRPDGTEQSGADVVLISNGPYRLEHLNGFGSRERMDAGVLGVVTISVNRASEVPALAAAEVSGRLSRFPGYTAWTTPEFVVTSGKPLVEVGVDGEALRLPPPLRFRSLPGVLRVRLPRNAPLVSPAQAAPVGVGRSAGALFAVLMGRPDPGPARSTGAGAQPHPAGRDDRGPSTRSGAGAT